MANYENKELQSGTDAEGADGGEAVAPELPAKEGESLPEEPVEIDPDEDIPDWLKDVQVKSDVGQSDKLADYSDYIHDLGLEKVGIPKRDVMLISVGFFLEKGLLLPPPDFDLNLILSAIQQIYDVVSGFDLDPSDLTRDTEAFYEAQAAVLSKTVQVNEIIAPLIAQLQKSNTDDSL